MTSDGLDEDEQDDVPWAGPVRARPERAAVGRPAVGRPAVGRPARTGARARIAAALEQATRRSKVVRRRSRSPLARRIARGRAGAVLVAAGVTTCVGLVVHDAESARGAWGRTVPVAVVRGDHGAGDEVRAGSVELHDWPAGLVPRTALRTLPEGRRFTTDVADGEVLLAGRIARPGAGSAAARLVEGRAAVTVPLGSAPPPLEVGDRVDVLAPPRASAEPWEANTAAAAEVVAASAEVIGVQDGHATLVVDHADVERTAAAILDGALTLALTG